LAEFGRHGFGQVSRHSFDFAGRLSSVEQVEDGLLPEGFPQSRDGRGSGAGECFNQPVDGSRRYEALDQRQNAPILATPNGF
jgi:hypothetical protein